MRRDTLRARGDMKPPVPLTTLDTRFPDPLVNVNHGNAARYHAGVPWWLNGASTLGKSDITKWAKAGQTEMVQLSPHYT